MSSLVRTGLLDGLDLGLLSEAGSWWTIADMRWGLAFYLDLLVVMAVGILSPLMALLAWLAALCAASDTRPSPAAQPAREVV